MPGFLSILLILGSLAVGGAGILPYFLQLCAAGAACVAFFFSRHNSSRRLILFTSLAIAFIVLTVLPLPPAADAIVGSRRARQNQLVRQTLVDTEKLSLACGQYLWLTLSRNRAGSMRTVLMLILCLSLGMVAAGTTTKCKWQILAGLIAIGAVVSAAGIAGIWLWPQGKTLWWVFPVEHGRPMGAFVNRNHCGGFAAMLSPAAMVFTLAAAQKKKTFSAVTGGLAFLVLTTCSILSLSRGAWLAYGAGFVALTASLALKKRLIAAVTTALISLSVAVAVGLKSQGVAERAETLRKGTKETTISMRLQTWKDAGRMFFDYPFFGIGANAFRSVFPQYRTADTRATFKHAENEYVQAVVELGLIGCVLFFLFALELFRDWHKKSSATAPDPLLSACAAATITVVGTHALCDFALRIPLYAAAFACCIGLSWPAPLSVEFKPRLPTFLFAGFLLALTLAICMAGNDIYDADNPDHLTRASLPKLAKALAWNPTSWQAWYHFGRKILDENPATTQKLAHWCMTVAAEYDPLNYRLWAELCMLRMSLGDEAGAREAFSRMKALRSWMVIRNNE